MKIRVVPVTFLAGGLVVDGRKANDHRRVSFADKTASDIQAEAWGLCLMRVDDKFYLLYYPQGREGWPSWAVALRTKEAVKVRKEIQRVSEDRMASWPKVQHIINLMS